MFEPSPAGNKLFDLVVALKNTTLDDFLEQFYGMRRKAVPKLFTEPN